MEKFMQRENVLLDYASKGVSENPQKSPYGSTEETDFNDVFGGPPRRFSMQEMRVRYSLSESVESEEEGASSSPWIVLKEKPVFGEETVERRRHQGDGFYDDIFKANESSVSSPRMTDRDWDNSLLSSPSSRVMSPSRPSPSNAEPFGTSLPAQFSLPAKLSKVVELPTFGSRDNKTDDSTSGLFSPRSPTASFSRFLTQAVKAVNRNEFHSVSRPSPLSRQASLSSEGSSSKITSDQKGNIEKLNKETKIVDSDASQFHFSIYKWAGIGVPMLMPLLGVNQLKSKDIGMYHKSVSSSGKMGNDHIKSKPSTVANIVHDSVKIETGKKDLKNREEAEELQASKDHKVQESKTQSKAKDSVNFGGATRIINQEQVKPVDEIDTREKTEKEVPVAIKELLKSKANHLVELLSDKVDQAGKVKEVKENKTRSPKEVSEVKENKTRSPKGISEVKENKTRSPTGAHTDEHISKNVKKKEGTRMDSDRANVEKSSLQGARKVSGVTPGKSGGKGKVRGFVHIFNQETDPKLKADVQTRSQSARWKAVSVDQTENEVKEKVNLHHVDKKPDVPPKVDKNINNDEPQQNSFTKNPSRRSDHPSTNQKNTFSSESLHRDRKISLDADDPFEVNFVVEELYDHEEKVKQSGEGAEDMKALEAKIQQWSVGKKGNIRSLLSTLQYVLWPGSGWKPVPLVDLIEANSVKRAYQKALLRIHPDKLQQKGAECTQKFIAEKVFDILQEAWDHFNTLAPL